VRANGRPGCMSCSRPVSSPSLADRACRHPTGRLPAHLTAHQRIPQHPTVKSCLPRPTAAHRTHLAPTSRPPQAPPSHLAPRSPPAPTSPPPTRCPPTKIPFTAIQHLLFIVSPHPLSLILPSAPRPPKIPPAITHRSITVQSQINYRSVTDSHSTVSPPSHTRSTSAPHPHVPSPRTPQSATHFTDCTAPTHSPASAMDPAEREGSDTPCRTALHSRHPRPSRA
jgi:hypothetical protein